VAERIREINDSIDFGFSDSSDVIPIKSDCCSALFSFSLFSKISPTFRERFDSTLLLSNYYFLIWARDGGLLPQLIIEHVMNCLNEVQREKRNCSSLVLSSDVYRCNSYWINAFTKGILNSRLPLIYSTDFDKEENRLILVDIETSRLHLMQETFSSLNAMDLVVQHMSVPRYKLERTLSVSNIDIAQFMAVGLGTSLIQGCSKSMQVLIDSLFCHILIHSQLWFN